MSYAELSRREHKFLEMTSLSVQEFEHLVPSFEHALQERMKQWCLDGKQRLGRPYTTSANCPLPTPEDRLLANAGLRENQCAASGAGTSVRPATK